MFNSSPKPTSSQHLTNSLDLYYMELQELMTTNLEVSEVFQIETSLRNLRKSYNHLQHFDKQYFLTHSKLDLALVQDRNR